MPGKSSIAALDTFRQGPLRTACRVPRRQAGKTPRGKCSFSRARPSGRAVLRPGPVAARPTVRRLGLAVIRQPKLSLRGALP